MMQKLAWSVIKQGVAAPVSCRFWDSCALYVSLCIIVYTPAYLLLFNSKDAWPVGMAAIKASCCCTTHIRLPAGTSMLKHDAAAGTRQHCQRSLVTSTNKPNMKPTKQQQTQ
jgi:hypothetical protein